jgi:2'-5' RNA ligase
VYKYFVGIELPEPTRSVVRAVMVEMGDLAPLPHITVKAPGGLTPDLTWLAGVEDVARHSQPFLVSFGPPGTFGVHVLYLSVHAEQLNRLHDQLVQSVALTSSDVGNSIEGGEYVPHITLARFDAGEDDRLRSAQSLASGLPPLEPCVAREIVVFRKDDDGPYSACRRLRLGPTA